MQKDDVISRQAAIDKINEQQRKLIYCFGFENDMVKIMDIAKSIVLDNPSADPEIIRCKDCKFYSAMNRETKTGICNLTMHQNFGDNWFCAGAERRTDERDKQTDGT